MSTNDIFLEDLGVKGFGFWVESGEALFGVGDEDTAVGCTLHCTEDTVARGCATETDIEVAFEASWSVFLIERFGELESAVWLSHTRVLISETELGESTALAKESSRIR